MRNWLIFFFISSVAFGCKEPFEPDLSGENLRVLTVEGYLDSDGKPSELYLGFTRRIYGENFGPGSTPALGAKVYLENSSGIQYELLDQGRGYYLFQHNIPENEIYYLRIFLEDSESFTSEPLRPMISTPIEEIGFEKDERGVEIYINTRGSRTVDDFIWTFEETYAFSPKFVSPFIYRPELGDVDTRRPEETIYLCYRTNLSSDLLMETSSNLTPVPNLS